MTYLRIFSGIFVLVLMAFSVATKTPSPHAVEGTSPARTDDPAPQATVATVANPDDQAVALLTPEPADEKPSLPPDHFSDVSKMVPPTLAEQMLREANRLRVNESLKLWLFNLDPSLCKAAQEYADLLARTRQQGHFADQGPEERAARAGFTGLLRTPGKLRSDGWTAYGLGEVLAFGHPDIEAAFQGWLDSPGHKEALMEPTYDVAGFGRNGTIYVGMFGNSQAPAPQPAASRPIRYTQPQPYRTFQQCGPSGCGPAMQSNRVQYQYQPRRGLFGRR